jgi:hypothetical protein
VEHNTSFTASLIFISRHQDSNLRACWDIVLSITMRGLTDTQLELLGRHTLEFPNVVSLELLNKRVGRQGAVDDCNGVRRLHIRVQLFGVGYITSVVHLGYIVTLSNDSSILGLGGYIPGYGLPGILVMGGFPYRETSQSIQSVSL